MASNEQLLRAVQVATRRLASSGKLDQLLGDVLRISVEAVGAEGGTIYLHDNQKSTLRFQFVLPPEVKDKLPILDLPDDYGLAGQSFQTRSTVRKEFPPKPASEANEFEKRTGVIVRSIIATPLMMEGETPIGVVQLLNKDRGAFTDEDGAVLETVAAVSTMAYLNAELTEESTRASSLLGMGKVSHDIGNLAASLHATLGYAEPALHGLKDALVDGDDEKMMYCEMLLDMTQDMHKSIDRIVGYARLISDLSVGRELRPKLELGRLGPVVQHSAAFLATEARRNHVDLREEIDLDAPTTLHDELYIFRIVQNLVGNAIKAVRETIPDDWINDPANEESTFGFVVVRYRFHDDAHLIEVQDSGPGMTREIADRILSGNMRSQWGKGGGSGWGTKIVLELAGTHHATVSIESEPGRGSTFVVSIPHRPCEPSLT